MIIIWKSYRINPIINITDMYSLFERRYDKGYHFIGEMHNFWECVYVENGSVCISADARIHRLKSGDIIFHNPLEMHKFFTDNDEGVTHFTFSFSAEGDFEDIISNKVFSLNDNQKSIIYSMIDYTKRQLKQHPVSNQVPLYIRALEISKINPLFTQMISTYICQLILSLSQNGTVTSVITTSDAELFKRAVEYMNSNIAIQISVKELAEFLNISQSSLKRLFNKYAGMGIHKYFLTLKIKAATLMLNSKVSISEIAEKLGFSSQGYFSATYKRETGKSPSAVKSPKFN